jgi:hypothetical protein
MLYRVLTIVGYLSVVGNTNSLANLRTTYMVSVIAIAD